MEGGREGLGSEGERGEALTESGEGAGVMGVGVEESGDLCGEGLDVSG